MHLHLCFPGSARFLRRVSLCLVGLLIFSAVASAQVATATVSGTVTDPTGAVVPTAVIELTNVDTNVVQTTRSNQAGFYSFTTVPPGQYRMEVKRTGFKTSVKADLILHVGDTIAENFTLEVGSASQKITVSGEAVPVNTQDATVSTLVERQTVENMPLNGRSFQGLITLSPGVATVAPSGASAGQFVVNGQRTDTNYFTVDGVSANVGAPASGGLNTGGVGATPTNSSTGGYNTILSVDALQEFRIATSNFAPEFGRTPGGQVSLVSRGGTNAFHGDVFDYLRNTVLDANDWYLNAGAKQRGVVQHNDFGGVVGGRIIKDKLFFFVSYEGLRLQAPSPSVKLVPTQAARDLAAKTNSGGVVGYMAQFANSYPLPDGNPSTPCTSFATCAANYTASFPGKSTLDSTSVRIDYSINQHMTLFGRYGHAPSNLSLDNSAYTTAIDNSTDSYTLGWTWILSSAMSNDFHFNFTQTKAITGFLPIYFKGDLSTIFPAGYAQFPSDKSLSYNIQIRGLPTDGMLLSPLQGNSANDGLNVNDSYNWVKGLHGLKFGADFRNLNPAVNQANFNQNNTFAQTTTALPGFPAIANVCPDSVLPAGSGATVPGYICGQATLSNLQHNYARQFNLKQYSFYAQDTWKVSRRLTITYGTRWDINPAFTSTNNTPVFSINPSTFNINDMSHVAINSFGTPPYETTWRSFSPRIGVAYHLSTSPKWGRVIRAGYGVFYDTGVQVSGVLGNPFNARFNNQGGGVNQPIVQYPLSQANAIFATLPQARLTLPVSQGAFDAIIDPHFKLPYVHELNFTVEQQLGREQTISAGYVGALGRRLIGPQLVPANFANVNTFAQINPITGAVTPDALQVFGNYSSSDFHSLQAKFQRQFARGLGAVASYTWSHSIDDASVSGMLGTTTLPTAAQLASNYPYGLLRGNSDFDIRHNFALSFVYDVPKPHNAFARAILGYWSIDPIYHYQTAVPLDVVTGLTGAIGGTAYAERPNVIPGVPLYVYGADCAAENLATQKINGCPGGRALNTAPVTAALAASAGCLAPTAGLTSNAKGAFCTPAPISGQNISGNLGRNVVRAYPLQEFDLSLHRDFPIHERIKLRFQTDMFNVFNHPQFGPENAGSLVGMNTTTWGVTSSMANAALGSQNSNGSGLNPIFQTGGPRNFQFSLKLFF